MGRSVIEWDAQIKTNGMFASYDRWGATDQLCIQDPLLTRLELRTRQLSGIGLPVSLSSESPDW